MHWALASIAVALAAVLFQFGAASVWIAVLSIGLKVALLALAVIAAVLGLLYLRRRFK